MPNIELTLCHDQNPFIERHSRSFGPGDTEASRRSRPGLACWGYRSNRGYRAIEKTGSVKAVYGNIDGSDIRAEFPKELCFICEGVKVYITHIAGYPERYNTMTRKAIEKQRPDLVICGHSHILKVMRDRSHGHLHMNPGAIGRHGFHQVRTMLRFSIDQGQIQDLEVLEYKR